MASDVLPRNESQLDWLLADLIRRVPGARSAALLSADGLPTAVHGLDRESADRLSAVASSLLSTARAADHMFGGRGEVRQIVIQLSGTLLFVSAAGEGSVLAVVADKDADAGVIGYEMGQLVQSVRPFLATPARSAESAIRSAAGQL